LAEADAGRKAEEDLEGRGKEDFYTASLRLRPMARYQTRIQMLVEKMVDDAYNASEQSASYDRHPCPHIHFRLFLVMIKHWIRGGSVMSGVMERHFATDAEGRVLDGGFDFVHGT
jgi:hypothetical protein